LSYGLATITVHFLDDVIGRLLTASWLGQAGASAWPGWNLLFLVMALVMSGISGARAGIERASSGMLRRATPVLSVAGMLVCLLVLYAGFVWRSNSVRAQAASAGPAQPAATTAQAAAPPPAEEAPKAPDAAPTVARAPTDELARAVALGVEGLVPLAEQYPKDPAVLKPLVMAFASRSTSLADAMAVATRLFQAAPESTADPDLRFLIKRGAGLPGQTSKLAIEAMTSHMGSAGPDLLYELMLNDAKMSAQAQALLAQPAIRERGTPALAVAYDLRLAKTCSAKVPLLKRAAELGDERSIALLAPLATGSRKGCGRRKKDPCPPPCAEEAKKFNETISRIVARGGTTRH
jgi:hypothetical protein